MYNEKRELVVYWNHLLERSNMDDNSSIEIIDLIDNQDQGRLSVESTTYCGRVRHGRETVLY